MSKKFKSQASSSRAASGALGSGAFGAFSQAGADQGDIPSSLSYIFEPPDLSLVSQPQVVVAFKNLLKKDSTTKSKALEDLLDFVCDSESQGARLEDGFLDAWFVYNHAFVQAKLYPRISIDASRRVRQLAHALQGYTVSITGKRIARHLPKMIGAWLAGLYDNDKLAVKAAQDSIIRAFPTEEKRQTIWKIYQSPILELVVDAVVQQTPLTLSDERTVRPDEADAKYARVVATALQTLNRLLAKSSAENLEKDSHLLETLFGSKSLWQLAHSEDAFVRRSLYGLCQTSVSAVGDYVEWKTLSTQLLSKALAADQHGSASDFSELLLNLTKIRPEIWSSYYSGKTSASKRLLQYIKKGSQGGSPSFWRNLQYLLQAIPIDVLCLGPQDAGSMVQSASSIMEALLEGISRREEPRLNLLAAWSSYVETSLWIAGKIGDTDSQLNFIQGYIFPVLEDYVLSTSNPSKWTIHHSAAVIVCAECFISVAGLANADVIHQLWAKLSGSISESIKLSAPEQSQNYETSQNEICLQSGRLFGLEAEILNKLSKLKDLSLVSDIFRDATRDIFHIALQTLRSRKGKPYGAASTIKDVVTQVPQLITDTDALASFLVENLPDLVSSPSSPDLVSALFACRQQQEFEVAFAKLIDAFRSSDLAVDRLAGLKVLFSSVTADDFSQYHQLEALVMEKVEQALHDNKQTWEVIVAVLGNPASCPAVSSHVLNRIVEGLAMGDTTLEALHGLSTIANMDPVKSYVTGQEGSKLLSKLLFLAESPSEEVAQLAGSLQATISRIPDAGGSKPAVDILKSSFDDVGEESLSVDALVAIAKGVSEAASEPSGPNLSSLFPSEKQWSNALELFLLNPPLPSLSIMSPLSGAMLNVERPSHELEVLSLPHDANQLPLAARLASYVTRLLSFIKVEALEPDLQKTVFLYVPLAAQLIEDNINVEGSTAILPLESPETRNEFADLVGEARQNIKQWINASFSSNSPPDIDSSPDIVNFWKNHLEQLQGNTPKAYRYAEVYARILSERDSLGKVDFAETSLEYAQKLDSSANPFILAAVVTAFKTSLAGLTLTTKMCNQLVAQATGLDELPEDEGLRKLIALNALLQGDGDFVEKIPTQRLVFLVKHLVKFLQSEEPSLRLVTEIMKVFRVVLPQLKTIYGSHWADIFAALKTLWESDKGSDEYLPALHASLRLFSCLRKLASDESNDDLEDAWAASQKSHVEALIGLLSEFGESILLSCVLLDRAKIAHLDPSFLPDMPWTITIDILDREIKQINVDHIEDVNGLFATLTIQSRGVQRAAYGVLHRVIPKSQEAISFNVALSDTVANLPDELLSLLFDVPTASNLSEYPLQEDVWMSIRSYLLSWKTVFDHFAFASLPVQEKYSANLKDNNCLDPLLEFMFDFLQFPQGKLVDASKFSVRLFELDEAESLEKEIQWLLSHIYYLCLRYLPNLTKAWWLDSKKRVKGPIETWTQKYISPLVIEDSLRNVSEWFSAQDWAGEEQALQVKVSYKAAEIVASIEIDEESPATSILISLPATYPLLQATVAGGHRVAVDERKWRSWLMTIQGVIMFSNGNLVDGLLAFRRNVQGALKGHGECAICYSVISTNMQTPNKRCATCKNTFHSDCLFRWFKSSNSSSCPLCRNNFLYS
ncbi:predicted protein [Uncinocarpus reesii 1704]|uniref:E3 ubiquitin-protein ligase listerin n=1 Tax=Uncinocarpus reesii (strain UAMH 1704) TaxID=336963 RepID=C4JYF3_UNCRE|nr:uncharacterized protein UREG_07204 [Uncinocarpus reesii 1704]EEP82339.1 predicted protein [Uncinocarpus reesii 1704]